VQFTLKNTLDGAVAGNFILGGIVGGVVDGISGRGGAYQDSVQVVLVRVDSPEESRVLPAEPKDQPPELSEGAVGSSEAPPATAATAAKPAAGAVEKSGTK
jgi:hypothetical protein